MIVIFGQHAFDGISSSTSTVFSFLHTLSPGSYSYKGDSDDGYNPEYEENGRSHTMESMTAQSMPLDASIGLPDPTKRLEEVRIARS